MTNRNGPRLVVGSIRRLCPKNLAVAGSLCFRRNGDEFPSKHAAVRVLQGWRIVWQSQGFPYDEGPKLIIEGDFQGRGVFLQVLAYAPDDEEPSMKLDTTRRSP